MIFRLLVTGSRNWNDWHAVDHAFTGVLVQLPAGSTLVVVHGNCPDGRPRRPPGLDAIADRWARSPIIAARHPEYTIIAEPHPADWERDCDSDCRHQPRRKNGRLYCPMAGNLRNQDMVDLGADGCLGFPLPGSRGTRDCMRRARAAGIRVNEIHLDGASPTAQ
ncbi:SLOG family protein [Nocardia sp. NPDC059239]|uniref:SLOG family protein n=1 Tax=unclassified Nocardia TaxID=2637762 RepID=UPI00368CBE84